MVFSFSEKQRVGKCRGAERSAESLQESAENVSHDRSLLKSTDRPAEMRYSKIIRKVSLPVVLDFSVMRFCLMQSEEMKSWQRPRFEDWQIIHIQ